MTFMGYFIVIVLFLVLDFFIYKYFHLNQTYFDLKKELNTQTLDYHLKKVKELGYDFTIKAGSHLKKAKSTPKSTAKGKKKGGSFKELIE